MRRRRDLQTSRSDFLFEGTNVDICDVLLVLLPRSTYRRSIAIPQKRRSIHQFLAKYDLGFNSWQYLWS